MSGSIQYTLRRNARSRSVRISIHGRDEIIVSAPPRVSESFIERFVASRRHWIENKLKELKDLPDHIFIKSSKKDFESFLHSDAFKKVTSWGRAEILRGRPRHKVYTND